MYFAWGCFSFFPRASALAMGELHLFVPPRLMILAERTQMAMAG